MKIVSYNILTSGIHLCGDRQSLLIKVLDYINGMEIQGKQIPIDILALQEADGFDSEHKDFMEKIKDSIGLKYSYVSKHGKDKNNLGYQSNTVIYSRWKAEVSHDFHEEISTAGLCLTINIPSLGKTAVTSLHLEAYSEEIRLKEMGIILPYLKKFDKQIMFGDFNSLCWDDNYDLNDMDDYIEKKFDVINKAQQAEYIDVAHKLKINKIHTYPTKNNDNEKITKPLRIDYIWTTRTLENMIQSGGVIHTPDSDMASDHYPIWAVLE